MVNYREKERVPVRTNHMAVPYNAKQVIFAHPLVFNLRLLEQWANHSSKEQVSISAASLVILIAFWEKDFLWAASSLCRIDKRIPCSCWILFRESVILYIIYYITLSVISIIIIYSELKGLHSMDMSVLSNRPAQR